MLAGASTTAALAAWRWGFSPVAGGGTLLPWTVLGLLVAAATVGTDRFTRPFVGIATTAAAAGVADLVSGGRQGLDPHRILDVLHLVPAAAVLATAVTGLHLFFLTVPQVRRPRAGVVVVLGSSAWVTWMGWWPLSDAAPAHPDALVAAAAATLLVATVVGEIVVGPWRGVVLALGSAAFLAWSPLVTSDSLGIVAWLVLVGAAAVGCLTAAGVVAAVRGAHRRLRPVAD